MHVRFLLGPAGSGKTWRCLSEIRAALQASPEGPPLLFLAPKQATFQLERQLLADPELPGYTRLQILSFERLGRFVLDEFADAAPRLLGDEGRVMVLRALLQRHRDALKVFRASARLPGFAQQLGQLLRELHRHQLSPERLEQVTVGLGARDEGRETREVHGEVPAARHSTLDTRHAPEALRDKLSDLALLLRAYRDWLREHRLEDADQLLDLATQSLTARQGVATPHSSPLTPLSALRLGGLWLDGFAEMTPQELGLLKSLVAISERATLAFCLEGEPTREGSWLSPWNLVAQTFRRCRAEVSTVPGVEVVVETLPRRAAEGRFSGSPALQYLESNWTVPAGSQNGATASGKQDQVGRVTPCAQFMEPTTTCGAHGVTHPTTDETPRLVRCPNPEAEATVAAREILRHVRAGGRFRDCAVLVRSLEGYHHALQRVFSRYGIPFFLDRREPIAHHPLAELTRYALRTVTLGWRHEDWFGTLKAGFVRVCDHELDWLENEALARGWQGDAWLAPLEVAGDSSLTETVERLRRRIVSPFQRLHEALASVKAHPSGAQLAAALRVLWDDLGVERQLDRWTEETTRDEGREPAALHATTWEQMNTWVESLALGFGAEALPLREWLPIVEAGLTGLTVGVVPPALDQVLVGAVDRSRNPDLKLAVVLGLNEGVFPAPPDARGLLTEADREALEHAGALLSAGARQRLAHERYLGYIACTRARERLVVTFAAHDARERLLNPSRFVTQLQQIFPGLAVAEFAPPADWSECEHLCELLPFLPPSAARFHSADRVPREVSGWPAVAPWSKRLGALAEPCPDESLSPPTVERLYGSALRTSVTALERFAECPFRFFVHSGLRAQERLRFEADPRALGSFQHEALKRFHEAARAHGSEWRDLQPEAARERMRRIATELAQTFNDRVLQANERNRFLAATRIKGLEDFVEITVRWLRGQYAFDPVAAELSFAEGGPLPPFELALSGGRRLVFNGQIDRVDVKRLPDGDAARCVVLDYKAGERHIDRRLLENGLQLQLPAYLCVLRHLADAKAVFGVTRLIPAGVFYVSLRGRYERGANREEVLRDAQARAQAFQHAGRFNQEALEDLDSRPQPPGEAKVGDQFNFRLTASGGVDKRSREPMPPDEFTAMLDRVEMLLHDAGERIFHGEAQVAPYRHGNETPCERCDYRAICRFDPWEHSFRALRAPGASRV